MTVNARYIICDLVRGNEISASLNPLKPDPCSALITVIIHPEKYPALDQCQIRSKVKIKTSEALQNESKIMN